VGSPANLYLLVNLRIFKVAGLASLHFVSWLLFGMPMALAFVLICWSMLRVTERSSMRAAVEDSHFAIQRNPMLSTAMRWSLVWLVYWIGALALTAAAEVGTASLWQTTLWGEQAVVTAADLAGVVFSVAVVLALFLVPHRVTGQRRVLMRPRDLLREVPVKGILFGVGVLVLLVVVAKSGAVGYLERLVDYLLPEGVGTFATVLVVVLVTIFSTEVLNNTTVATVLFPLSIAIAKRAAIDPLLLMLAVSLASTCAFMTPVATPVNALAFAGVGGIKLRTFVKNGLIANLAAALWIAVWINWLVPPVLGWFR
jgi:sodium-dependent dicarboxylate transporter 2/3/5